MAYGASATIAVATATPKVNAKDVATVTLTNSGTVDINVDGVEIIPVDSSPLLLGSVSPDDLPQAGSNQASGYGVKTVANGGGTATFKFTVIAPLAGTFYLNANIVGTRADTGVRVQIPTSSAATITASV